MNRNDGEAFIKPPKSLQTLANKKVSDKAIDSFTKQPQFSTLVNLLQYRALEQPQQVAFTFVKSGQTQIDTITYEQLDCRAKAIATQLRSLGIGSGERALLLYPSGLDYIAAFFGCLYAKVVAVPAYPPRPNQSLYRILAIVKDAQIKIALTIEDISSKLKEKFTQCLTPDLQNLHWLTTDKISTDLAQIWQEPAIESNTLAFLQYTSGSTGMPKGVMLKHNNLLHNLHLIHQKFEHTSNSQGAIWLPPYHDMGLIGGILQPLYGGFPVVLMPSMDFLLKPFDWLKLISCYKATTSGGPNFAYKLCVDKISAEQRSNLDLSSWEVAFVGAEPICAQTLKRFAETFEPCGFHPQAFYPCYGLAEATLFVSGGNKTDLPIVQEIQGKALEQNQVGVVSTKQQGTRTIVGCGKAPSNQKIVIVNVDSLTSCPSDHVGEIWVTSPSVAQGYWNRSQETNQTFNAYLADTGEGPFLRTGDLGFLHDGELFITGRSKDVIIIRGSNYYPHDIEMVVEKSHLALQPVCGAAFTVEVEGEERLVVVNEVKRTYLRNLDYDEVVGNIRQEVLRHCQLQIYAVALIKTGTIPKTSSGKIQRHMCRDKFLDKTLDLVKA